MKITYKTVKPMNVRSRLLSYGTVDIVHRDYTVVGDVV